MVKTIYDRQEYFVVFEGQGPGIHFLKTSKQGDEVKAYIAKHPKALVDEPVPPEPTREQKAAAIRLRRNGLLSACDWTQLGDVPVDERVWADYRQKLRDVTGQVSFPDSVEWPVKPM